MPYVRPCTRHLPQWRLHRSLSAKSVADLEQLALNGTREWQQGLRCSEQRLLRSRLLWRPIPQSSLDNAPACSVQPVRSMSPCACEQCTQIVAAASSWLRCLGSLISGKFAGQQLPHRGCRPRSRSGAAAAEGELCRCRETARAQILPGRLHGATPRPSGHRNVPFPGHVSTERSRPELFTVRRSAHNSDRCQCSLLNCS